MKRMCAFAVDSIAAFVTPISHDVPKPISASVLGMPLASAGDIARIASLRSNLKS